MADGKLIIATSQKQVSVFRGLYDGLAKTWSKKRIYLSWPLHKNGLLNSLNSILPSFNYFDDHIMECSTMYESTVSFLTCVVGVAIGIIVLIKGHASTHALLELTILVWVGPTQFVLPPTGKFASCVDSAINIIESIGIRIPESRRASILANCEAFDQSDWKYSSKLFPILRYLAALGLLVMLSLEVLGISIADSDHWNYGFAGGILGSGALGIYIICLWFSNSLRKGESDADEIADVEGGTSID